MSNRYDSLDKYYKTIEKFDSASTFAYWVTVGVSICLLCINKQPLSDILSKIFIVLTVLFCILNNVLKIYLIPRAENKRRVHLLTNALGVNLDNEHTENYYNNRIPPSLRKIAANVLENALFAKKVVTKMLVYERISIAAYAMIFLGLILAKEIDLSILAIVAQTIFSAEIISKWLYMEYLRIENERIFEDIYKIFLGYTESKKLEFDAQIIDNFVKYEAIKAYCGIKQSSKIFFKINAETGQEWEEIKKKLNIDELQ